MNNTNNLEIINIVKSIIYHLNDTNLDKMTHKMIDLPIKTVDLLEEIAFLIHTRALRRQNYTVVYAKLCAFMINDSNFNNIEDCKNTFQKCIVENCSKVFNMYKTIQKDIEKINEKFKCIKNNMTPRKFKDDLSNFLFDYYNTSLANCKFIAELYNQGALPEKILLVCITELSKEEDDLQMHCLCVLLKLVGSKLAKTFNLADIVKHILLLKKDKSITNEMSSTLKSLILEVQNLFLNSWKNEGTVQSVEINYHDFQRLPINLKNYYDLKSYKIMAVCILEECYEVLFNFSKQRDIEVIVHLFTVRNTWICHDQVSYVVSLILVAIEEGQNIRRDAGKLINYLVEEKWLSNYSVKLGVNKVLDDPGMNIEFPKLNHLILTITRELKF